VSFRRFPDTIDGEAFWEKDSPSFAPSWVKTLRVPRKSGESDIHYVLVLNVEVEFVEWTDSGKLRHAAFRRVVDR
jgi:DNA primase